MSSQLDECGYQSGFGNEFATEALPGALPPGLPLYRHYGLYAYRVPFLRAFPSLAPAPIERFEALEQLRALWHGYRIAVQITHGTPAPGIDTPEDLARVREIFANAGNAGRTR